MGAALAKAYAAPGVTLALTGRNAERLAQTVAACQQQGAEVISAALDVTDRQALATWLLSLGSVDMIIANAGISAGTGIFGESEEQARAIFATNLDGVLNSIHPLLPAMRARGQGHIVIMSSVASFHGIAGAPAYCASKGAVRMYGEALAAELRPQGIAVSVVCPGFIRTPMTDVNNFPMPFLMEADDAARLIKCRLSKRPLRLAFPWPVYWAMRLLDMLPLALSRRLLVNAPRKSGRKS